MLFTTRLTIGTCELQCSYGYGADHFPPHGTVAFPVTETYNGYNDDIKSA